MDLGGKHFEDRGEGETTFCQTSNNLASPSFNLLYGTLKSRDVNMRTKNLMENLPCRNSERSMMKITRKMDMTQHLIQPEMGVRI